MLITLHITIKNILITMTIKISFFEDVKEKSKIQFFYKNKLSQSKGQIN